MPFDRQPILTGFLVKARPLLPEDRDALYSVASDPLIWKQHPASNRYLENEFEKYFLDAIESQGALLVVSTDTSDVIGSSRYHGFNEEESEIEIGWTFLARKYWGGKYNGELKQLMLSHAFKFVKTVIFRIGPENLRSQKSVEKIGGVKDDNLDIKGNVVYRVTKSTYLEHNAAT